MSDRDERIRELRAEGWSQSTIADTFGISQVRVSQILGRPRGPRCSRCGGPIRRDSATGICARNPECKRESDRLIHQTPEYRAKQRAWNKTPEARARQRAANNTPEAKARRTAWHMTYRARPEIRAREVLLSVKSRGLTTDLTTDYLISIYTGRCMRQHCGKLLAQGARTGRGDSPNLDRIIPAKGYTQGNVQWLCGTCNRRKQDMTSTEMLEMLLDQLRAEGWAPERVAQRLHQAAEAL